jgi:FMN phosphatase YigB (HAD superfamily)
MVGDNPSTDIAGAVSAGWRAIWFNPNHIDSPVPAGVLVVDSLDKIFAD